ncbi:hypothetical protein [Amycolatopsis sp. NPDC054798]
MVLLGSGLDVGDGRFLGQVPARMPVPDTGSLRGDVAQWAAAVERAR